MGEQGSARSVVKSVLRGGPPLRPLLMPLTFFLASRIDNLPLRDFVTNPTKIVNALRQIRAALRVDGVTCYFDPFLEIEVLGGKLEWRADGPVLAVGPQYSHGDDLRARCGSPEQILSRGRIPIVADVLRRLKVLLKDEPALTVGVTGPLRLASQLSTNLGEEPQREFVEFAAEITGVLAKHFVEAGADVIFLNENLPLAANAEAWEWWGGLLDPVINMVRFYDALPVLLPNETVSVAQASKLLERSGEWVPCLTPSLVTELGLRSVPRSMGIALPATLFGSGGDRGDVGHFREMVMHVKPDFVTTTTDLQSQADLKQVARLLGVFREVLSSAA